MMSFVWMRNILCCFSLALLLSMNFGCGRSYSCPSCPFLLLTLDKPDVNPPVGSETEQILVQIKLQDGAQWLVPTTQKYKKTEGVFRYDSNVNNDEQVTVGARELKSDVEYKGKTYNQISQIQVAFTLSQAGKESLRNGEFQVRFFSPVQGDTVPIVKSGGEIVIQKRQELKVTLSGSWLYGTNGCKTFQLKEGKFLANNSASKGGWGGNCQ